MGRRGLRVEGTRGERGDRAGEKEKQKGEGTEESEK